MIHMRTKRPLNFDKLPRDYAGLVRMLVPRPIHDAQQAAEVEEMVFCMAPRQDLTEDQRDYLYILSDQLHQYQQATDPLPEPPPAHERLAILLEESGTTQAKLAKLLGVGESYVSLVVKGKRGLTTTHVKTLAAHFKMQAEYFL